MGLRKFFEIREEQSFAECVKGLGGYGVVDDLTEHISWRLARDPIGHSFAVPELKSRITFTEGLGEQIPVMRIILRIYVEERLVSLTWIENVEDAPPIGFDDWL